MGREARTSDSISVKLLGEIVLCLWRCVQRYIEFLTKMAVVACAVTGDAFCPSAKKTQSLLWRNNLVGLNVDSFAGWTLFMFSVAVAVVMGYAPYFAPLSGATKNFASGFGWGGGLVALVVC